MGQMRKITRCFLMTGVWIFLLALVPSLAQAQPGRPEVLPDRSTPRRAMEGFLQAVRNSDDIRAALFLDLRSLPKAKQSKEGPGTAHKLGTVLEYKLLIEPHKLSDEIEGDAGDGPNSDIVGTLLLEEEAVPITLTRIRADDGSQLWLISKTTVTMVPALYAMYGPGVLADHVPPILIQIRFLGLGAWQWGGMFLALLLAFMGAFVIVAITFAIVGFFTKRTRNPWDDVLLASVRAPTRLLLSTLTFSQLCELLHLTAVAQLIIDRISAVGFIFGCSWLLIRTVRTAAHALEGRLAVDTVVEMRNRGVRTQLIMMRKLVSLAIGLFAIAVALLQFEVVRNVGVSLLASAGVFGVVLGFAAQKTIGNLVAGVQLSITQPIRLGDTVVIEGEWGLVEEIRLTYAVLRLWDKRRLVVPITKFLETSFQNWTKVSPELLGVVFVHTDYSVPLERVDEELHRLAAMHPYWDGKTCKLQMTDVTDRVVTLRALVSGPDADKTFDLRCDIRAGLIKFLQQLDGGSHLPQNRQGMAAGAQAAMFSGVALPSSLPSEATPLATSPANGPRLEHLAL